MSLLPVSVVEVTVSAGVMEVGAGGADVAVATGVDVAVTAVVAVTVIVAVNGIMVAVGFIGTGESVVDSEDCVSGEIVAGAKAGSPLCQPGVLEFLICRPPGYSAHIVTKCRMEKSRNMD